MEVIKIRKRKPTVFGASVNLLDVITVKEWLKEGKKPESFGEQIGAGSYRVAYRYKSLVIKAFVPHCCQTHRTSYRAVGKILESCGCRVAPQIRVRKWVIQKYYLPLTVNPPYCRKIRNDDIPDFRPANCGIDDDGVVVAFDY